MVKTSRYKTELKIQFVKRESMSKEGIKQWTPRLRRYVHKYVYIPEFATTLHISQLCNKEVVCETTKDLVGEGVWLMKGMTGKRSKKLKKRIRCWETLAMITVFPTNKGLKARISDFLKISRRWYWDDAEKNKRVY